MCIVLIAGAPGLGLLRTTTFETRSCPAAGKTVCTRAAVVRVDFEAGLLFGAGAGVGAAVVVVAVVVVAVVVVVAGGAVLSASPWAATTDAATATKPIA
jgi:hypothetical protein